MIFFIHYNLFCQKYKFTYFFTYLLTYLVNPAAEQIMPNSAAGYSHRSVSIFSIRIFPCIYETGMNVKIC